MQDEVLTPSYHGELCRHNGDNPNYDIACDECDYYLACFPDWKEYIEKESSRYYEKSKSNTNP